MRYWRVCFAFVDLKYCGHVDECVSVRALLACMLSLSLHDKEKLVSANGMLLTACMFVLTNFFFNFL